MSASIDPKVRVVYGRLWRYVVPHKFIGFIAIVGMAVTAVVQASLVYLLEPLMDEALVAQNLKTARSLGMLTHKVGDPAEAIRWLFALLEPTSAVRRGTS